MTQPGFLSINVAAIDGGKLICYWNMTWLSYYAPDGTLGNSEIYGTLLRAMSNNERLATSLLKLFNYHQVTYSETLTY